MISLVSPNGQFGCLTVRIGQLTLTCGLTRELLGIDLSWKDRMLVAIPANQRLS